MKYSYTWLLIAGLAFSATSQAQTGAADILRLRPICNVSSDESDPATDHYRVQPRRLGLHESASLTSLGSPRIPVILVQFPDLRFRTALGTYTDDNGATAYNFCETDEQCAIVNDYFDKFCNGLRDGSHYTAAGSNGAVREYFEDQSNGLFTPEFVVIGPVTLDESYAYYGKNSGNSKDVNLSRFYSEAIQKAQAQGIDWGQFDNDGNQTVDMTMFIYAGNGENAVSIDTPDRENLIWPQERASGGQIDGQRYGAYACTCELLGNNPDGIGLFIHEMSHALGLPDFYDTNYVAYGLDYWDVMDSGCYCRNGYQPCGYSAYEKDFMGWQSLVLLERTQARHITVQPAWDGGLGYKMVNPENPDEYYIVENRQNRRWDAYIGRGTDRSLRHGLLITHVDYRRASWTSNTVNTSKNHQRMTIVPADGTLDSYMYVETEADYANFNLSAQGDLYPGIGGVTALSPDKATVFTTTGDTPGLLGQSIVNIVENTDGSIEFDYMTGTGIDASVASVASAPSPHPAAICDLSGRTVGAIGQISVQQLKPGIYLIGAQKIMVK